MKARGLYKNGEKIGIRNEYHYDGSLKAKESYKKNQKNRSRVYSDNKADIVSVIFYHCDFQQAQLPNMADKKNIFF